MTLSPRSGVILILPALLACLLAALRLAHAGTEGERIVDLHRQAMAAYERKDYPAFYAKASSLAKLLPEDAETAFLLARAASLTGRSGEAERLLGRLVSLNAYFDAPGSPDLAAIRESESFRSTVAALERLRKTPVGTETIAFRLPEKDFLPEAIAWDPGTKGFLVSSVRHRKVVRVGPDGTARDLVPEGAGGMWSAEGIAVDPRRRVLYVCSSAFPQTLGVRPEDRGRASLLAFHADSGKLLGRWPLAGGEKGHSCDSVGVSSRGDVYVTDGVTGEVRRLRRGGKRLETLLPAGVLISAQSPVLGPREKELFIPDYARGIFRVDLATRGARLLSPPKDVDLSGIDGLAFYRGSLIAIQNGLQPNRVLRLRLSPGLDRIERVETLARALPVFDEPTLATVVDGTLYYVANSQWDKFDDDGRLPKPEELNGPVILKVPLGP